MLHYVNCNMEKICIIDLRIRQRLERRHKFSLKLNQFHFFRTPITIRNLKNVGMNWTY